jgi:hypothetical protein
MDASSQTVDFDQNQGLYREIEICWRKLLPLWLEAYWQALPHQHVA